MFGIGQFFNKFNDAFAKEAAIRGAVQAAIQKHIGIEVPITSIAFKSDTVMLSDVSQSLRSAVYIKKQQILKDIAEKQSERVVKDIR